MIAATASTGEAARFVPSPGAPPRGQVTPLVGATVMNVSNPIGEKGSRHWTLQLGFDSEYVREAVAALIEHQERVLRERGAGGASPPAAKRARRAPPLRYRSQFEEREHPRLRDIVHCDFYEDTSRVWRGPAKRRDSFCNLAVGTPCYAWLHCAGVECRDESGTATMRLSVAHLWADSPTWTRFPFRTDLEVQGALPQSYAQQPPRAADLKVPAPGGAAASSLYQRGANDRRGRWLQEHIRFRVRGEVLSDDFGKLSVAIEPADLAPLRALDALQAAAAGGAGASFHSLVREIGGGRWSMQAKLHLDGQEPATKFWRTEHTPWSLPGDARLWRYRELEAGRDPARFDRMSEDEQRSALAALHRGDRAGRPAVREVAMHEMQGRVVEGVLDVRGYWVWSRSSDRPPMAGHRIHFEHIWVVE